MKRRKLNNRLCSFESLEDRRLLAGDVTARISNGKLVIHGDKLDNAITIAAGATAGQVVITGVNDGNATATSVNGTSNGTVTLNGFTGGLSVSMGQGNDNVTMTGLTVGGKAKLKGGKGNDTFTIAATSTFNSSLSAKLGQGNNTFAMTGTTVTGKTTIHTEKGNDTATITNATLTNLKVKMEQGDDQLGIIGTTVSGKTNLNGGSGTNVLTQGAGNSLGDLTIKHFNQNVAPTVSLDTIAAVTENNPLTLTGTITDSDVANTHTLTIDWADANNSTDSTFSIPATSSLTAGQIINSTSGDGAQLKIVTPNTTTGVVTFSVQHTYVDDGIAGTTASPQNNTASDQSVVKATITDAGPIPGTGTTTVTINNSVPTGALTPLTGTANTSSTLNGSYTDIGFTDIHTLTVNWGDSTTNSVFTVPGIKNGSGTTTLTTGATFTASDGSVLTIGAINTTTGQVAFTATHTFTTTGTKTVTLTVADDDLGTNASPITTTATIS